MRLIAWLVTTLLLAQSWSIDARPDILAAWEQRYPNSLSSQRGCQLCHQQDLGQDGWNSYGFGVRFQFIEVFGSLDIQAAFQAMEDQNSDGDANNLSNLQEIQNNLDPGWIVGPFNPIFFKDGSTLENQVPPFNDTDRTSTSTLCYPIKAKNGRTITVCL